MDMGGHVAEHHRPHRKSAVPPLFGHTGRVDIIGDHRARAMRRRGLTFRQIARERGVSLTRAPRCARPAPAITSRTTIALGSPVARRLHTVCPSVTAAAVP